MALSLHQPLHDPSDWVPTLQEKKDFKQVSFVVPKYLLPTARKVLSARYRHQLSSLPQVKVEWEDWNTDRDRFIIDNEDDDLSHFSDTLPHPDLYQNTCRVWSEDSKIITLQTYYTTGTILAQGTECILWRQDKLENLTKVINAVYNHFSLTRGISDSHTFRHDIESLALPDMSSDINNKEAIGRGVTPLGTEHTPVSDDKEQTCEEDVCLMAAAADTPNPKSDDESEEITNPATHTGPDTVTGACDTLPQSEESHRQAAPPTPSDLTRCQDNLPSHPAQHTCVVKVTQQPIPTAEERQPLTEHGNTDAHDNTPNRHDGLNTAIMDYHANIQIPAPLSHIFLPAGFLPVKSRLSIPGFHDNTTKKRFGARSFKCSAPALWNALPPSLKSSTSTESFRSHLKTYLFSKF
nr:hypothetical protein BaRGS_002182 [Batillaria attramentaria]